MHADPSSSAFYEHAVKDIASGAAIKKMQSVAAGVVEDTTRELGGSCEVHDGFASLGTRGKWTSKVERDFHTWVDHARRKKGIKLEFYSVDLTMKGKGGIPRKMKHDFLVMHEVFAVLYEIGGSTWSDTMLGPAGDNSEIEAYWRHEWNAEWFQRHPARRSPEALPWTIPFGMHGDDVQAIEGQPKR